MSADVPAKYLNSPGDAALPQGRSCSTTTTTPARPPTTAGTVIAVEGYVDVIAMTLGGLPADAWRRSARR